MREEERADGRRTLIAASGAALLSLLLGIPHALRGALWADEVASARVIAQPTAQAAVAQVARTESTPPGWYLLAWTGHRAGVPIADLRLLSVACASTLCGLLVLYARTLLPLAAAALAGVLAALDWEIAYHGRELRAYALLALLSGAFGFALARAAEAPTVGRCGALAALACAGVFTHYFFLFTLASGLVWIAAARSLGRARLRLALATVVPALTLAAWAGPLLAQYHRGNYAWIGGFDPLKLAAFYSTLFDGAGWIYGRRRALALDGSLAWRLCLAALVLYGCFALARRSREGRLCAALAFGPVALAALAWLAGPPIFDTRNLIGVAPFVVVAVAEAVARLPRPSAIAAGATAIAGCAMLLPLHPLGPPADRIAAALTADGWTPADPIALVGRTSPYQLPLGWYLPGRPQLALEPGASDRRCRETYLLAPRRPRALPPGRRVRTVAGEAIIPLADDPVLCRTALPAAHVLVAVRTRLHRGAGRRARPAAEGAPRTAV